MDASLPCRPPLLQVTQRTQRAGRTCSPSRPNATSIHMRPVWRPGQWYATPTSSSTSTLSSSRSPEAHTEGGGGGVCTECELRSVLGGVGWGGIASQAGGRTAAGWSSLTCSLVWYAHSVGSSTARFNLSSLGGPPASPKVLRTHVACKVQECRMLQRKRLRCPARYTTQQLAMAPAPCARRPPLRAMPRRTFLLRHCLCAAHRHQRLWLQVGLHQEVRGGPLGHHDVRVRRGQGVGLDDRRTGRKGLRAGRVG